MRRENQQIIDNLPRLQANDFNYKELCTWLLKFTQRLFSLTWL